MDIYMRLTYDEYKDLEHQLECFHELETTHTSTPGPFYHKSLRLEIGGDLTIEFHGPTVKGDDSPSP
jgi:hypothetical protein